MCFLANLARYDLTNCCRKTDAKEDPFYARVLYSGQPIETIHGRLDWISLSQLVSIMSPYVPEDIVSLCG